MTQDLILQTQIGQHKRLQKLLTLMGRNEPIEPPCAVRLKGVDPVMFETQWRPLLEDMEIDANWVDSNLKLKNFRLFATDMDSTWLQLETLDEIAAAAGKGEEVSRITTLAMQGKITNYAESLKARVAMLKGVDADIIFRILSQPILPNPGASDLIGALTWARIPTVLVSGGFSCVTRVIKQRYGFTHVLSNELYFDEHGKLTGEVTGPYGSPIIDGIGKLAYINAYANEYGCTMDEVISMGDGSNDIPMLESSGMSVAWHAKPKVRPHAKQALSFSPLSGLMAFFSDNPLER